MLTAVREGAPFNRALEQGLAGLTDRDRRLAHEIAAGVLRARTALDTALKPSIKPRWDRVDPALKDILRIGAYQLLSLERVPSHAAVETSVELAKTRLGVKPAGLVNAVLRKLAAQPATSPPGNSHPEWLVKRWTARFGAEGARRIIEHDDRIPPLVIQPARWPAEVLAGALERGGIAFVPAPGGSGFEVTGAGVRDLPGYAEGGFVVQDPAQAQVLAFANFSPGTTVWDACAAPGGKTVALARDHTIIASDIRNERVRQLEASVRRAAPGVPLFVADARRPPLADRAMDGVLLDAPCSATGTLARHPDARWRLTPRRIASLAKLQSELLETVSRVVRPGGILVYATCSLEPEENENQVNQFLETHPDFRRTRDDLFIVPGARASDGAYAARLERAA